MFDQKEFDKSFDTPFFRDPEGYMKRKKRNMFILIASVFILGMVGYGAMINKAHNEGKTFYTIEVVSFGTSRSFQSDSIISQTPNTVKFIDIFGRKQMVTGENIIVTGY